MGSVTEIRNYDQQSSFINGNPRAIIFFGSKYCHHCHDMMEIVTKLAGKYPYVKFAHVEVTEVDVDNVGPVPVSVIYLNYNPVQVVLGANENKLVNLIETMLS